MKLSSFAIAVAGAAVAVVAGSETRAFADEGACGPTVETYLNVKLPEPTQKDPKPMPLVEAIVVGGPGGKPAKSWSLVQNDAKVKTTIGATNLRKFTEGSDTIAVVLVLEGHQWFIGTDEIPDMIEDDKLQGVLKKLIPMVDPISKIGPPGSLGGIVIYHQGAEIKLPMGPLTNMNGAALGTQMDYKGKITRDLVTGINTALTELRRVTTSRKAMIIVGDGADTNLDEAKSQLNIIKKQCEADRIELYALSYDAGIGEFVTAIKTLVPNGKIVQSIEGIDKEMQAIVDRINDRYTLTFPGHDKKAGIGFTWDGNDHEMQLKLDGKECKDPILLALSPPWNRPTPESDFPWLAIIIPVGALIFIWLLAKIFGRKKKEEPMPMPIAEVPAPKPAGPMKTAMFSVGGDADGFPIVGWIVPLNGPQGYQTFRLLQGLTKIGTAGNVHIIISDGFMSTEHCQIVGSPQGFQIQDNKSTNGCFVNDKKIDRHDLVDNDVITLGKTHIVFKSIN
jgi:hypothetical protein